MSTWAVKREVPAKLNYLMGFWKRPFGVTKSVKTPDSLLYVYDLARGGNLDVVKNAVKNNPDLLFSKDKDGITLLHAAACSYHHQVAEYLLASGADASVKDNNGTTPLHYAAREGEFEAAEVLVKNRADVNAKTSDGWTPLFFAAKKGNDALAKLLLDNGANVNACDTGGFTPLCVGIAGKWTVTKSDLVAMLLARGADVNTRNEKEGMTCLHMAALNKHTDVVELLLANKAEVNAKDKFGATPLHYAANQGHREVSELLVMNKAEVNAKSNNGLTPLLAAVQMGHKDVAELLRQHGGHE